MLSSYFPESNQKKHGLYTIQRFCDKHARSVDYLENLNALPFALRIFYAQINIDEINSHHHLREILNLLPRTRNCRLEFARNFINTVGSEYDHCGNEDHLRIIQDYPNLDSIQFVKKNSGCQNLIDYLRLIPDLSTCLAELAKYEDEINTGHDLSAVCATLPTILAQSFASKRFAQLKFPKAGFITALEVLPVDERRTSAEKYPGKMRSYEFEDICKLLSDEDRKEYSLKHYADISISHTLDLYHVIKYLPEEVRVELIYAHLKCNKSVDIDYMIMICELLSLENAAKSAMLLTDLNEKLHKYVVHRLLKHIPTDKRILYLRRYIDTKELSDSLIDISPLLTDDQKVDFVYRLAERESPKDLSDLIIYVRSLPKNQERFKFILKYWRDNHKTSDIDTVRTIAKMLPIELRNEFYMRFRHFNEKRNLFTVSCARYTPHEEHFAFILEDFYNKNEPRYQEYDNHVFHRIDSQYELTRAMHCLPKNKRETYLGRFVKFLTPDSLHYIKRKNRFKFLTNNHGDFRVDMSLLMMLFPNQRLLYLQSLADFDSKLADGTTYDYQDILNIIVALPIKDRLKFFNKFLLNKLYIFDINKQFFIKIAIPLLREKDRAYIIKKYNVHFTARIDLFELLASIKKERSHKSEHLKLDLTRIYTSQIKNGHDIARALHHFDLISDERYTFLIEHLSKIKQDEFPLIVVSMNCNLTSESLQQFTTLIRQLSTPSRENNASQNATKISDVNKLNFYEFITLLKSGSNVNNVDLVKKFPYRDAFQFAKTLQYISINARMGCAAARSSLLIKFYHLYAIVKSLPEESRYSFVIKRKHLITTDAQRASLLSLLPQNVHKSFTALCGNRAPLKPNSLFSRSHNNSDTKIKDNITYFNQLISQRLNSK